MSESASSSPDGPMLDKCMTRALRMPSTFQPKSNCRLNPSWRRMAAGPITLVTAPPVQVIEGSPPPRPPAPHGDLSVSQLRRGFLVGSAGLDHLQDRGRRDARLSNARRTEALCRTESDGWGPPFSGSTPWTRDSRISRARRCSISELPRLQLPEI
jgi:hypothetical protein